jgi:ATP-binding cassette subfamily F protein uup
MLEKFLFSPAAQYAVIGNLSGGERRRLYLLRILMGSPNVLLLDEPTNDLDIPTLIALEEYLDDFAGALIVVSHDRYFLDRTIENVFRFEPGGHVREFAGDYSAYLETVEREEAQQSKPVEAQKPKAAAAPANKPQSKKLTFKETRELEELEKNIAAAEARLPAIEKELALSASDAGKVHQLFTEQQKLEAELDANMSRWAELAERAESK